MRIGSDSQSTLMLPLRTMSAQTFRSFAIISLNSSGDLIGISAKPIARNFSTVSGIPVLLVDAALPASAPTR